MDIALLGIIGLIVIISLWHFPELGIALYLYNGVFKTAPIFANIDPIIPTLFIFLGTVGTFLLREKKELRKKIALDSVLFFIILFNVLILFSAFGISHHTDKAMRLGFFTMVSFTLAALTAQYPKRLLRAFKFIILLSFGTAILSIFNYFTTSVTGDIGVVTLFAANDVIYGRSIGLGVVMILGLRLYHPTLMLFWKRFLLAALFVAFFNLVLSTSRGALVGVIAAVFFMVFLTKIKIPKWFWLALVVTSICFWFIFTTMGEHLSGLSGFAVLAGGELDTSSLQRLFFYQIAINQFISNPIFGVGISSNLHYPHNIFLEIASELGIIGLVVFLLVGLFVLLKIFHLLNTAKGTNQYTISHLLLGGLVYSAVIVQFSGNLQMQREFWMFIALCWAVNNNEIQENLSA